MRFATIGGPDAHRLAVIDREGRALELAALDPALPGDMLGLIAAGPECLARIAGLLGTAPAGAWRPAGALRLAAPIPQMRKNVFCVGRNYREHILEGARARGVEPSFPQVPEFFSKPPTTVIGPEAGIRRHAAHVKQPDYEVELGVVIGRRARDLSPETALEAVFGYTIVNDVTARDVQRAHGQWFKGKGFDTFCPMGPWIVTADEFGAPSGHRISLTVNGEQRQDSNTADMLFGVADILVHLSRGMTLEPGDVIATGTPSGVGMGLTPQIWLKPGDVIEASVAGIGTLRNPVID